MKDMKCFKHILKIAMLVSFIAVNMLALPQQSSAVCRNLVPTDPYYNDWTYCCDINTSVGHSSWIRKGGSGKKERFTGSCSYWGVKDTPKKSVCRNLRQGDPYHGTWRRCCDEGNNKSRWFKRYGGDESGGIYNGNCKSWGINP